MQNHQNAGAARGHWGRFGTAQLQIADCRLQIGELNPPSSLPSPPGEGGARGHHGQPKLRNSERAVEWNNLRLSSLVLAYLRLMGKKCLRRFWSIDARSEPAVSRFHPFVHFA